MIYTTKEQITDCANNPNGGFVNTSGEWCAASSPERFKGMLETLGFNVVKCNETPTCTAYAETDCGINIAWNGYCHRVH